MVQTNKSWASPHGSIKVQYAEHESHEALNDVNVNLKNSNEKNPILHKRTLLDNQRPDNGQRKADNKLNIDELPHDDNEIDSDLHHRIVDNSADIDRIIKGNFSDQITIVEIPKNILEQNIKVQNTNTDSEHQVQHPRTEGRIAVYGDSNCLDSTHIEKPCFWLLNAMLEYTMTSHVPGVLSNLNKAHTIKLPDGK